MSDDEDTGSGRTVTGEELARIAEKIVALWEAHASSGRPYLVSALGLDMGADLSRLKTLTGSGLTSFIRLHLSEKVQLIRLGAHANVDALIGVGAEPSSVMDIPLGQPRYNYRFWAAFSVPLAGRRRLLDLAHFTFTDDDDDDTAAVPEGKIVIDEKYIVGGEVSDRDEVIKGNIKDWFAANDLAPDSFYQNKALSEPPATPARTKPGTSVLEAMIGALDRRQLQGTQLSLDVVAALLRAQLG